VIKKYGKNKEEEKLEQGVDAREIVKTVMDYGVSQYQIKKILYLLSLELEDRNLADSVCEDFHLAVDTEKNRKP
jgi:hypothetical protein